MARVKGSEELFTLIHKLTKEEKGYFKKYATRHSAAGSVNLKLFDAVQKQTVFEEKSLVRKFKSYPVLKVYLKEMITDCLLLYYRSNHPHISLLSQVQKAHVLLLKGLRSEALKIIEKAIKQSIAMELPAISLYLQRLRMQAGAKALLSAEQSLQLRDDYNRDTRQQIQLEEDQLQWELTALSAFGKLKASDAFKSVDMSAELKKVTGTTSLSKRSNILKLQTIFDMYRIEISEAHLLGAAKKYKDALQDFKEHYDTSYDDVAALNNYMYTLGSYGKLTERNEISDLLIQKPRYNQTEYNQILINCVIYKYGGLLHQGKFKEALDWARSMQKDFDHAIAFTGNTVKALVLGEHKIVNLFVLKKYTETWLALNEADQKSMRRSSDISYTDAEMIKIMTQMMIGNFDLVKSMALKCRKEFARINIQSYTYDALIRYFIKADALNYKAGAKKLLEELTAYYSANKKFHRKAFAILRYTYWLEEISGGRTIQQSLQAQYGKS